MRAAPIALFAVAAVGTAIAPMAWAEEQECKTELLSQRQRRKLAEKLNKMIDVPILGEDQEQFLADKVVDMCVDAFSEEELRELKAEFKRKVVTRLNNRINIPFADEKLEARVLGKVVDFLMKDIFSADADKDDDPDVE